MQNIKKYRGLLGLSQQQLAEAIGVTRTTINFLENDDCHNTSPENINKLCELFCCSQVELFGFDNFKYKPTNDVDKIYLINALLKSLDNKETYKNYLIKVIRDL